MRARSHWITIQILATAAFTALGANTTFADILKVGGSGGALGIARALSDEFERTHPRVTVEIPASLGSGGGIKAVLAGALDIGLSTRPLKDKEIKAGAVATVFARTPFVFVTAAPKPADGVRLADVPDIYAGRIREWPDGKPIRIILRPRNDSDTADLLAFVPDMTDALDAAFDRKSVPVAYTNQDAKAMIARVQGSFGVSSLAGVLSEGHKIEALTVDGVKPTVENLVNGTYRLYKDFRAVTKPNPSPLAKQYLEFLKSPAAVAMLQRLGCAPGQTAN